MTSNEKKKFNIDYPLHYVTARSLSFYFPSFSSSRIAAALMPMTLINQSNILLLILLAVKGVFQN